MGSEKKTKRLSLLEGYRRVPDLLREARDQVDEITDTPSPSYTEALDQHSLEPRLQAGLAPGQPTFQPTYQPSTPLTTEPTSQPSYRPPFQPGSQPGNEVAYLSEKQFALYLCFKRLGGRPTNLVRLAESTGIPYETIKTNLKVLKHKGLITTTFHKLSKMSGLVAKVIEKPVYLTDKSEYLIQRVAGMDIANILMFSDMSDSINLAVNPTNNLATNRPINPATHIPQTVFSSSVNIPTTSDSSQPAYCSNLEQTLMEHPELGYWREQGLTSRQVSVWMAETKMPIENMIQSLCHARFDLVDRKLQETKPVAKPINWFYAVIKKTGFYSKPSDYKSYLELQLEHEDEIIREKQQLISQLKERNMRRLELDSELRFQEMMSKPESDLYMKCKKKLTAFVRNREHESPQVFYDAMWQVFKEIQREQVAGNLA